MDPNDATIAGISLGGLFPSWVLLNQPETFQRYVIISPSIWWNQEEVWKWESHFAQNHNDINAKVFVTAGGLETSEELKKVQPLINSILKRISSKNIEYLRKRYRHNEDILEIFQEMYNLDAH